MSDISPGCATESEAEVFCEHRTKFAECDGMLVIRVGEPLKMVLVSPPNLTRRSEEDQVWRQGKAEPLIDAGVRHAHGYLTAACTITRETRALFRKPASRCARREKTPRRCLDRPRSYVGSNILTHVTSLAGTCGCARHFSVCSKPSDAMRCSCATGTSSLSGTC
jgi:hypothetical protein